MAACIRDHYYILDVFEMAAVFEEDIDSDNESRHGYGELILYRTYHRLHLFSEERLVFE
jgi:hypothetical protein